VSASVASRTARSPRLAAVRWRTPAIVLAILLLWEVAGRLGAASGALPAPTAVVAAWWQHRADYPAHILATLRVAGAGFVVGNLTAVLLAVAYQLVPALERLLRATTVFLFCVPVVVAAPILGIALKGDGPQIALSALLVFFPTLIATHFGLAHAPGDAIGVVRAAGGGVFGQLRLVRLRAALPDLFGGLQVAAPAAVLGAMLGEFLGSRYGLGIYLIGSMGRGEPAVIWAIGLTATALSALLYGVVGLVRTLAGIERARPTADPAPAPRPRGGSAARRALASLAWGIAGIAVLIGLWYLWIAATGLPRTLMNGPDQVIGRLFTGPRSTQTWEAVGAALAASAPAALWGSAAGILTAFVLGIVLGSSRTIASAVMPLAFVSQTIPLVALAPLLALLLGRGDATTIAVTVSVTFFPALVTIMAGIASAPTGPLDVLRSVNASWWTSLTRVVVPNAVPHLLAAVRLTVPRALTGVLIAEQYITGTGLGGLLGVSRGHLDYSMMWVVTAIVAAISVATYAIAQALETAVLRRRTA
jgi:sulfonate transport system permease protein